MYSALPQGLIALVRDYLRGQDDIEADTMCTLSNYWQLLSQRASGGALVHGPGLGVGPGSSVGLGSSVGPGPGSSVIPGSRFDHGPDP